MNLQNDEVTAEEPAQGEPKFEMRGFNAAPEPAEGGMTAEEADAMAGGLPPEVTGEEAAPEEPKKETKVKIGSREFANPEDAWAYAQELEQEKLAADAFRHGIETAAQAGLGNPQAAQPAAPEEETIDPEFYSNPTAYHKKLAAKIKAEMKQETQQEQELRQRNDSTWQKFYTDYPDLANAQELVQLKLNENWEKLKFVKTEVALKEVAEKARELKRRIAGDAAPGRELNAVKQTASPGNGIQVTRPQAEEKASTFIQQMNNLKKKRTARPMRR